MRNITCSAHFDNVELNNISNRFNVYRHTMAIFFNFANLKVSKQINECVRNSQDRIRTIDEESVGNGEVTAQKGNIHSPLYKATLTANSKLINHHHHHLHTMSVDIQLGNLYASDESKRDFAKLRVREHFLLYQMDMWGYDVLIAEVSYVIFYLSKSTTTNINIISLEIPDGTAKVVSERVATSRSTSKYSIPTTRN